MKTKKPKIVIKKVALQNAKELTRLVCELADFERLSKPKRLAQKRLIRDATCKKPKFFAFLAYYNRIPAGYLIYYFTYSSFLAKPTLFIEDLFVSERFRAKGIGKKLFEFALAKAKKHDCGRVEFLVLNWNKKAQSFYRRYGARTQPWFLFRLNPEQILNRKGRHKTKNTSRYNKIR